MIGVLRYDWRNIHTKFIKNSIPKSLEDSNLPLDFEETQRTFKDLSVVSP